MFKILSNAKLIGRTDFEFGDPPMGVAFGAFFPGQEFEEFKLNTPSSTDGDPRLKRWTELSILAPGDRVLRCRGVVLLEVDLEDALEHEITVFGVEEYQDLFPEHLRAYENQFK